MKFILLILFSFCTCASAADYYFQIDPFSGVTFRAAAGNEHARIIDADKFEEVILLNSKIKKTGKDTYTSPGGTIISIKELPKTLIRHKGARHEFTANWTMDITGKGKEFDEILKAWKFAEVKEEPGTIRIWGYKKK